MTGEKAVILSGGREAPAVEEPPSEGHHARNGHGAHRSGDALRSAARERWACAPSPSTSSRTAPAQLYIGVTSKLDERMNAHRARLVRGFSAKYQLDRLVYIEQYPTARDAIAREKEFRGRRQAEGRADRSAESHLA